MVEFQTTLGEMVRRIVAQCQPRQVILFGSRATGHATATSDVDLLVVAEGRVPKRQQAVALYRALRDLGVPKDIVVVRPEEFSRYRDVRGTVIYSAAHDGRVVYEHAA